MKYNNQNLDFEVYVRLHDLKKILSKYQPDEEFDEEMSRHLELIRTKRYRVAVLGEFSRGKSSLINALLGSSILPADILPATATINRVTFGFDPHVEIVYKNGTREDIAIDAMEQYVTKLSQESQEKAATIEEAVVVYPTVICQNYIDIIDTPGLNESEDMTFLTKSQLNKIDAAIVTISALSPLSETERTLITSLIESEEIGYLIFAVSFIDRIDEEDVDRVLDNIRDRIRQIADELSEKHGVESDIAKKAEHILRQPELYGISTKKALKAFETNNSKLLKESYFADFQKALYRILTTQQNVNAIHKSLKMILGMREKLENWYQRKHEELEKNIQRIQETKIALESFLAQELTLMQELLQKHLVESDTSIVSNYLNDQYRLVCIDELAKVTQDNAASIIQAINICEIRMNEITQNYLNKTHEILKEQVLNALHLFLVQRNQRVVEVMNEADVEYRQKLQNRMDEAIKAAASLAPIYPQNYAFQYTGIANIKHCNLITFLEQQSKVHSGLVLNSLKQNFENIWSIGIKTANEDTEDAEEVLAMYQQYIHNTITDRLLYEREYVQHQEELKDIFNYCENLIEKILY